MAGKPLACRPAQTPLYLPALASAHRLAVRTPPFHGGNRGSIPRGRASKNKDLADRDLVVSNGWPISDDEGGRYNTGAVCLKGHAVAGDIESHPPGKFCSTCGAAVLTSCPGCGAPVRGHFVPPGVTAIGGPYSPPSFCFECGKRFRPFCISGKLL
jgi:hypothetical protein